MSTDVNSPVAINSNFVNIMDIKIKEPDVSPSKRKEIRVDNLEQDSRSEMSPELKITSDLRQLHHPFDDVLAHTTGDITIVMKVSTNLLLANRILAMVKGLASHIKLSID